MHSLACPPLPAAKCNAAPGLMRLVLARMAAEDSIQQRVNLLYLVDSILQASHSGLSKEPRFGSPWLQSWDRRPAC